MTGFLRLVAVGAAAFLGVIGAASSANPPLARTGTPAIFHYANGADTLTINEMGLLERGSKQKTLYVRTMLTSTCTSDCGLGPESVQLLLRNGKRIDAVVDTDPDVGLWDGTTLNVDNSFAHSGDARLMFKLPVRPRYGTKAWKATAIAGLVITIGSETHGWAFSPPY